MTTQNNPLQSWEKQHWKTVILELREAGITITPENIPRIVREMSFAVRSKKHPDECPYYQMSPPRPCHSVQDLNCILCACPNYNSQTLEGGCKINSASGKYTHHKNLPAGKVWDCSNCSFGHSPSYIEEFLKHKMGWLQELDKSY